MNEQAFNNLIKLDFNLSENFKKINFQDLNFIKKIHEGYVFDIYLG